MSTGESEWRNFKCNSSEELRRALDTTLHGLYLTFVLQVLELYNKQITNKAISIAKTILHASRL